MNPFDPAALSPRPRTRPWQPRALPFGITRADLQPALAASLAIDGTERLWPARLLDSHEKQGLHGGDNSSILTVELGSRTVTLFLKQSVDAHKHEAARYRYLAGEAVPTPHLWCSVARPPAEVVVLEFLPRIGIDFSSDHEVAALLLAIARLNFARPSPDLVRPGPGTPPALFDAGVLAALTTLANDPAARLDPDRWFAAYRRAGALVAKLPPALCHGELFFQQVGWAQRSGRPTLVLFDFETLAYRPRLTDVAGVVGYLARHTRHTEPELLAMYLEELRRLGGVGIDLQAALAELRLVRWFDACCSLPWRLRRSAEAPDTLPEREPIGIMSEDLAAIGF